MIHVILHNIRSVYNVGSIFRTADGAGVSRVYCTGFTPTPVDKYGRKRDDFKKVALGAEETVAWESGTLSEILTNLNESRSTIVAVEQSPESIDYRDLDVSGDCAFIFGNEVDGLSKDVLEQADAIVEIPMHGRKRSLNVAMAAGIVLYNTRR